MACCTPLFTFLCMIISVLVSGWKYDKGPYGRQTKQYVSRPYKSLKEECARARRIVEHCHKGKGGVQQYTECDYKTNFLRPTLRVVTCVYPKEKCVENYSDEYKTNAKCVDETTKPSFPKTGTISWKGTVAYDAANFYWRPRVGPRERTANVNGKIWLDDRGNFYRKELKVTEWPGKWDNDMDNKEPAVLKTEFLILNVDENGWSTQYKGSGSYCRSGAGGSPPSLSSIWKPFNWWSSFKIHSRKRLDGGLEEQVWVEKIVGEEWDSTVTWKMNYDKRTGFAVPISMESIYNSDEYGRDTERYDYHYKPLGEDDKSIDVPGFC